MLHNSTQSARHYSVSIANTKQWTISLEGFYAIVFHITLVGSMISLVFMPFRNVFSLFPFFGIFYMNEMFRELCRLKFRAYYFSFICMRWTLSCIFLHDCALLTNELPKTMFLFIIYWNTPKFIAVVLWIWSWKCVM